MDRLEEQYRAIEDRAAQLDAVRAALDEKQERLTDSREFGAKEVSAEQRDELHRAAMVDYIRNGVAEMKPEHRELLNETRALATQLVGTDGKGGYTVPTELDASVRTAMKAYGGMREVATILTTSHGRDITVPASDDTGNVASLIAEATAITASTHVPFTSITLEAPKYKSGPIKIARELLEDTAIDIEAYIRNAMAIRFGRGTEAHFATRSSTESSGPHGITNDSTGAVNVAASSVTVGKLIDLETKVDPAYRMNARWMFNDATRVLIRKLREGSSGAFLWQPSVAMGDPDTLLGYPVTVNQNLASFGTSSNKPVFFGDFSHYTIRDSGPFVMRRLEERYAEEDVVALLAFARIDGRATFGSTAPAQKPFRCIIVSTA
jgi:HK97 family phage major capsid protein